MGQRNYDEVVRRVRAQQSANLTSRVLAEVEGYPILGISIGFEQGLPTALVIGGVHGDEPAGVEAVLRFLERDPGPWMGRLAFEVLPCLNPYGWVHHTRHNAQDLDINWSYSRNDVVEVQLIKNLVRNRRFEFVLDCHEDWESSGFYLYELRRGSEQIGPEILWRVSEICPLNTSAEIEGQPARGGLVFPDPTKEQELRGQGIPLEMYYRHTDHLLTSETPTSTELETRVSAHLMTLDAVIEDHLRQV